MKLKTLYVSGFESAMDPVTVDFTDKKMVGFIGQNGTGKSMLAVWAPMFALFGKVRQDTMTEAINSASGAADVELVFNVSGTDYKVYRSLPRIGSQSASLYMHDADQDEWVPVTEKGAKAVNAEIISILGMNYDIAASTFVAEQGQYGLFCEALPSKRREILASLLNLDGYKELKESADKAFKQAQDDVLRYESQIESARESRSNLPTGNPEYAQWDAEDLEGRVFEVRHEVEEAQKAVAAAQARHQNAEKDVLTAQNAVREFQSQRDQKIAGLTRHINSLNASANPSRLRSLQKEEEGIRDARMRAPGVERELEEIRGRIDSGENMVAQDNAALESITSEAATVKAERASAVASLEETNEQEAELRRSAEHGAQCLTCRQPLSQDLYERVLSTIQEQKNGLSQRMAGADQRLEELRGSFSEGKRALASKESLLKHLREQGDGLLREQASLGQVLSREQSLAQAIQEAQDAIQQAQTELSERQKELSDLQAQEVPQALLEAVKDAEAARAAVQAGEAPAQVDPRPARELASLERELTTRENTAETVKRLEEQVENLTQSLQATQVTMENYNVLRKAFSPTGIPAMIMAGAVQEIEEEANKYLSRFSNGELSLNIETQKATNKGKSMEEKIFVTVNAPDGTRGYKSFSGGQQFRINLAVRIAQSKLYARRNGSATIQTMFIDEGFGALDNDGILHVMTGLTALSEDVSVIAVSHIQDVKAGFEHLFETSLETGTTTVSEVTNGA